MIIKPITYENLDGIEVTKEFMFHLNKKEALELELETPNGGMTSMLRNLIKEGDMKPVLEKYEEVLIRSYGRRSDDGETFIKDPEEQKAFGKTEAFAELFTELATDKVKAAEFIAGVLPGRGGNRVNAEAILEQAEKEFESLTEEVKNETKQLEPSALEVV